MYIARHYVRVNGKMFTPGEVITEKMTADKVAFLMEKDAINEIADTSPSKQEGKLVDGLQKENGEQENNANQEQKNTESESDAEDEADEETEAEDMDEADEEAEAPEIDVTDGIVAEPEPEEAPAVTPRKRSSKKK